MRPAKLALLFVSLFTCLLLVPGYGVSPFGRSLHAENDRDGSDERSEDTEKRHQWFQFQRSYPADSIPIDGRLNAWKQAQANQSSALTLPSPSSSPARWRSIGPNPIVLGPDNPPPLLKDAHFEGRIDTLAISPADDRVILVGACTGGIWRSSDGGVNFAPVADDQVDMAVGWIAFARSSPNIVYAAMGNRSSGYVGRGVLKSTNGGQSWARISNDTFPSGITYEIAVDPTDSDRVYVAQFKTLETDGSTPQGGLLVSTDGGVNWNNTLKGYATAVVIDPQAPEIVYAAEKGGSDNSGTRTPGIHKSTDSGSTWKNVLDRSQDPWGPEIRMGISHGQPTTVYALSTGYPFDVKLFVSSNGGDDWATRDTTHLITVQAPDYLAVDPSNPRTLYAGFGDVYKSTDGGSNWTNLTGNWNDDGSSNYDGAKIHTDQHSIALSPANSSAVYFGCDGGLYKSTDAGDRFEALNDTLSIAQFYSIAVHPTDGSITYGGTQDNGTEMRSGVGNQWDMFAQGDGGPVVIDPLKPDVVFQTNPGVYINRRELDHVRIQQRTLRSR